jgi:hypothetical protein
MDRRRFLLTSLAGAFAVPVTVHAQQATGLAPMAEASLGLAVYSVEYSGPEDLDQMMATLKGRPSAVFFWGDRLIDNPPSTPRSYLRC